MWKKIVLVLVTIIMLTGCYREATEGATREETVETTLAPLTINTNPTRTIEIYDINGNMIFSVIGEVHFSNGVISVNTEIDDYEMYAEDLGNE